MFSTALQQGSNEWVQYRQYCERVSSTELSSVIRLNKYKTCEKVREEKIYPNKIRFFDNAATQHGRAWEPVGLDMFSNLFDPQHLMDWRSPGLLLDNYYPLCASPDRMVFIHDVHHVLGVELKTVYSRAVPQTPLEIYDEHLIQCLTCLFISNAWCWFLVYFDPKPMEIVFFEITFDPKFCSFAEQAVDFIRGLHQENNLTKNEKSIIKTHNKQRLEEIRKKVIGPFRDLESWKKATKIILPLSIQDRKEPTTIDSSPFVDNQKANLQEEIHISQK